MPLRESERKKSALLMALKGYSILPAIGLACFRLPAWAMFRSEHNYLDSNVSLISHIIQALAIVLFLIIDRRLAYTERGLLHAATVSTVGTLGGTALFCLAPYGIEYAYVGTAITGAVSTIPLLVWGYYFCSVDPRKSSFQLTLAFALYGCTTALLSNLPASWAMAPMFTCPLVSLLCLWLSIDRDNARVPAQPPLTLNDLKRLPWGVLAVLLVCTVSNTLAKVLSPVSDSSYASASRMYWPIIFTLVFAIFFVWIFVLKRSDTWRLWPVFAILIFSGLLCYATLSAAQPAFAISFFRAVQDGVMLFCYVVAASAVFRLSLPAIPVFGLMTLFFVKPPIIVSSLMTQPSFGSESGTQAIVITALTAFVLIVMTVIASNLDALNRLRPSATGEARDDSSSAPDSPKSSAEAAARLGAAFDLTQRETEMAQYLLNGYTMPQMADTLCVSIDTIRSHCKNLYRKTGVHKKQELVRLAERLCADD